MNQGSNERGRGRKKELAVVFREDQGKKRKKIKKRIFTERSIPLKEMAIPPNLSRHWRHCCLRGGVSRHFCWRVQEQLSLLLVAARLCC